MDIPWILPVFVAVVIIVIAIHIITKRKSKLTVPCPKCEATDVVEINRETIGSRTIENIGAGTPAGGNIRLQLDFALTFRCQNCNRKFTHNFTQTQ